MTDPIVEFTIPGRPRGKERPRVAPGQSRPYTPADTVRAEKEILALWMQAVRTRKPALGPIRITIMAVFPIPQGWTGALLEAARAGRVHYIGKPDRDNIEKLVTDALNGAAWVDDGQIVDGPVVKRYGDPARTTVRIETLDNGLVPATPGQSRREQRVAQGLPPSAPRAKRAKPTKSGIKKLPDALRRAVERALAKERP